MGSQGLASALDSVHDLGPLILERADASEARGCLDDDVVDGLFETGLMRALVPNDLDGLDLTIPDVIELVRVLSTYDASVGWTYAIGVGGPLAGRLLTRDAFETIFRDPRAWMAGSLNPTTSKAEAVDGGYRFSGLANFASGCRHATWLMVGGWVHRDGKPSFTDAGPEFIAGVIPIEQVRVTDTWSVTGMRATGSNDCVIEDAFAANDWVFPWFGAKPRFETGTFGRIPLLMQFGPGLAATAVGAARGAQKRFIALASEKRPVGAPADARRAVVRADGSGRSGGTDPRGGGRAGCGRGRDVAKRRERRGLRPLHPGGVPHAPRDCRAARGPCRRPDPRCRGDARDRGAVSPRASVARRPRLDRSTSC